jgi:hypothetical protein
MSYERRNGTPDTRTLHARVVSLVLESDLLPSRFTLMIFAALQGVAFLTTKECPYVACEFLQDVLPYRYWAYLFLLYAVIKLWRIFDGKARPTVAKIVNGYGAALFGGFATALLVARWPYWVLVVPYIVLAASAIWVFARTAIYPGRGFRAD